MLITVERIIPLYQLQKVLIHYILKKKNFSCFQGPEFPCADFLAVSSFLQAMCQGAFCTELLPMSLAAPPRQPAGTELGKRQFCILLVMLLQAAFLSIKDTFVFSCLGSMMNCGDSQEQQVSSSIFFSYGLLSSAAFFLVGSMSNSFRAGFVISTQQLYCDQHPQLPHRQRPVCAAKCCGSRLVTPSFQFPNTTSHSP